MRNNRNSINNGIKNTASKSPELFYIIKNIFEDSNYIEGGISKLKAVSEMLVDFLELIKKSNEIDSSVLDDIKFIVNDYLDEIQHIYNS